MKLDEAIKLLSEAGVPDPEFDARSIFLSIGGVALYDLRRADVCAGALLDAIRRRASREPLQYILGKVGFYKEEYKVSPDCLIPRSDTEILVDLAVREMPKGGRFLDLCTGSGCVAISTLANTEDTTAIAVDISDGAIRIAKENAAINNVESRLTLLKADLMTEEDAFFGAYDAVLSNPPYIRQDVYEGLEKEIFMEPSIAFVGGEDGLDFYRRILDLCPRMVKPGGFIAMEIGFDQGDALLGLCRERGLDGSIVKDLCGNDRVVFIKI